MERTYETKNELISLIRKELKERGFGVNDIVTGTRVDINIFNDWNHIMVCDKLEDRDNWWYVDYCSVDVLLEAYKTVLHTWKY